MPPRIALNRYVAAFASSIRDDGRGRARAARGDTPPIDWQAALAREAQASADAKSGPRFKDFGFPRRAPPAAKAPEFAWDRNHTHRVESGGAALIVHINDNCMFVMTPLPFVFCNPGKRLANGDLFGPMKDLPDGANGNSQ